VPGSISRELVQRIAGSSHAEIPWIFTPLSDDTVTKVFAWPMQAGFQIAPGETYYRYDKQKRETGQEWWEDEFGVEGGIRDIEWNTITVDRECAHPTRDCRNDA
jgi:hypothetical protein